ALFMSPLRNPISHPTTQLGNTIPVGHGRPQFVVLDTNKSARSAVRPSLRWEKNLFFARCRSVRGRWRTARSGLHAAVDFGAGAADVHAAMRLGASAAGAVADADL